MKTKIYFLTLLFAGTSAIFAQQTQPKAGADKDTYGCIASAGYTTFEQKIQLKEIATKGNFTAAVLFNKDQSKAEIFLKDEKTSLILKRTAKAVWKNAIYTLTKNKGFVLSKNKKPIYKL